MDQTISSTLKTFLQLLQEVHPASIEDISDGLLESFRMECGQCRETYQENPSLLESHRRWMSALPETEKTKCLQELEEILSS